MKNSTQIVIPFPDYPAPRQRKPRAHKAFPVIVVKEPKPVFTPHPKFEVSEVDLIYKSKHKACDRPVVYDSKSAAEILRSCWDDNKLDMVEQFNMLLLNRANAVLALYQMSTGGITGTVADPRLAFATALKCNAVSMVLSHNHPSGNLKPSRADEDLTVKFKEAGRFLDIKVMDHIILTRDGYLSFADEGLI